MIDPDYLKKIAASQPNLPQLELVAAADEIIALRSKLDAAQKEIDRLVGVIGEHVTVRGEYYDRYKAAESRLDSALESCALNAENEAGYQQRIHELEDRLSGVLNVCAEAHKYDGVETFAMEVRAQAEGLLAPDSRMTGNTFGPAPVVERQSPK